MARLIRDKYLANQQECLARFNQLKANEEELNRMVRKGWVRPFFISIRWKL